MSEIVIVKRARFEYVVRLNDRFIGASSTLGGARWLARKHYRTITFRARLRCFITGHDVRDWGALYGWCHRCEHSVHNYGSRRRVLYYGAYHSFPPAHTAAFREERK